MLATVVGAQVVGCRQGGSARHGLPQKLALGSSLHCHLKYSGCSGARGPVLERDSGNRIRRLLALAVDAVLVNCHLPALGRSLHSHSQPTGSGGSSARRLDLERSTRLGASFGHNTLEYPNKATK